MNPNGHQNNNKSLVSQDDLLPNVIKRTEKLITALYMVTDCMENDEPLKKKLRFLGIDLFSETQSLAFITPTLRNFSITELIHKIEEIISFLKLSSSVGFISNMNFSVLGNEFVSLRNILEAEQMESESKKITEFSLPTDLFNEEDNNLALLENSKGQGNGHKKIKNNEYYEVERKERQKAIIKIVKEKKEVSIRDVLKIIPDCNPKTIQRDFVFLIREGVLKKSGNKRWARYSI